MVGAGQRWHRLRTSNCNDIAGKTASTYTPVAADLGKTLKVRVVAHNSSGDSAGATSAASGVVLVSTQAIYWANANTGTLWRANLDGSGAGQLISGADAPTGVAVDGAHVYWTNLNGGTIGRARRRGADTFSVPVRR